MILRIIVWIIGLLSISSLFSKYQKKEISLGSFLLWLLLWAGVIAGVTASPETDKIAVYLGLGRGRGAELALFAAILIILYLMFRLYLKISQVETQISEIVKNIALMNVKKKRRKDR